MVRAKFRVSSKAESDCGFEVSLEPVTGGSPENERFYRITPGHLATINAEAASELRVGSEYFVDFTEAPPEQK